MLAPFFLKVRRGVKITREKTDLHIGVSTRMHGWRIYVQTNDCSIYEGANHFYFLPI